MVEFPTNMVLMDESLELFIYVVCETISTVATPGLLCHDNEDDCGEADGM
jgi:hypothetical protein